MKREYVIIGAVVLVAGLVGYFYYKFSLPDFMPVTEDDAERLANITIE